MSADDAPITDPVPADASADPIPPRSHELPEDDSASPSDRRVLFDAADDGRTLDVTRTPDSTGLTRTLRALPLRPVGPRRPRSARADYAQYRSTSAAAASLVFR